MTRFATLDDVPLQEAWGHEAHDFTPWLAENLGRLSEAIGIPLELTDTEVAVESFSADILARNPQDDSVVLIENQFKPSDHGHLGQIMTYLAGLSAHTIIWIAPYFREPHLSAIRWLNEHTEEPFAFFAVKLRVVRIENSPLVPLFEVIERPNHWDRQVQETARQADVPIHGDIRLGFVYDRAPHIQLSSIAKNSEIDIIWEEAQKTLEPLRADLNQALGKKWDEWEIARDADPKWSEAAKKLHAAWWEARIERQRKIDASITKAADVEMLYDRPYADNSRVRVAGPFTVESLSPHRVVPADEDMLADEMKAADGKRRRSKIMAPPTDFADMVLEHLRTAGVHQAEKRDTIKFTSLTGWPGEYICAEAHFQEGETQRRAAIFLGPEFGTLSRVDLVAAAREATEARFDVLIACSFNFDAHASELTRLGPLPILKAKMNPDLHMADELKNTGKGNLFVVFGEPDIDIEDQGDETIVVKVNGIDVFDPNTGQIRSNDVKGIAAWFIDTDYNEESFFVRHAYFLGANDPYASLKTTLKAEIDPEAWATLNSDTSRPFEKPKSGRIAVKVINHLGDEVMKVFRV
jgi:adenine-specific DNA-methyltransferase